MTVTSLLLSSLLLSNSVWASDEYVPLKSGEHAVGGVLTTTYQVDNQPLDNTEYLYSIDLDLTVQFDGWGAYGWLEYARSTDAKSVTNRFENTNADAGTAVDKQGKGRAQLSEFYLYGNTDSEGNHGWKVGLSEVTTLVDTSAIANEEVSQFLSLELVNNMTISFPDYALSAMVQDLSWNGHENFGYRLVASSSHGVQDSTDPDEIDKIQSYTELFDVTAKDKGVFGAGELLFKTKVYEANVGYWHNSGSNASANWGLYSGVDYFSDVGNFNLRYGWASAQKEQAEQFYSIAYQRDIAGGTLAGGYTLTRFNQADDVHHLEVYYRKELSDKVFVTPMVQWASGMTLGDWDETNYWLFGLRLEFWM